MFRKIIFVHSVSITKTSQLILFRQIIIVYCANHMKHTNTYIIWEKCRISG
jgi:hypothetical protein